MQDVLLDGWVVRPAGGSYFINGNLSFGAHAEVWFITQSFIVCLTQIEVSKGKKVMVIAALVSRLAPAVGMWWV